MAQTTGQDDADKTVTGLISRCITRTELAVSEATRAADSAVRTETAVKEMRDTLKRIADRSVESVTTGKMHPFVMPTPAAAFPTNWSGRFALVGFIATISAIVTFSIVACAQHGFIVAPVAPALSSR